MTLFQIFITFSILLFLVLYGRYINILFERVVTLLITLGAVFLVFSPETASSLARLVGIGRGADLIFYLFIIYSWFWFNTTTAKMQRTDQNLTRIVRNIAIATPLFGRNGSYKTGPVKG